MTVEPACCHGRSHPANGPAEGSTAAPLPGSRAADGGAGVRRANGALESAVLTVLWEAGEPLSAAEVREGLTDQGRDGTGELAYTTVVTILTRLYEKNTLSRERDGRAFRYAPTTDEAGLAAQRLARMLNRSPDRNAVLSRFIEDLSDRDERLLRDLLVARSTRACPDAP
jgi:predicted transcriptional regulator